MYNLLFSVHSSSKSLHYNYSTLRLIYTVNGSVFYSLSVFRDLLAVLQNPHLR